ncbi:MAG: long-chain fatty acid--CoA ligase, partial [Acidobacteriota bacterium]
MDAAGRRLTGAARQLRDRVARFVADSGADDFDALAHDVFRLQYDHLAPFRRLCATRGTTPDAITDWRDVPAVPTAAFRRHALALLPAAEIFRSSGT